MENSLLLSALENANTLLEDIIDNNVRNVQITEVLNTSSTSAIEGESTPSNSNFTFPKKTSRVKNTSSELLNRNIMSNNYFGPLAFINNSGPEVNRDDDNISGMEKGIECSATFLPSPSLALPSSKKKHSRPDIVINHHPEREKDLRQKKNVVPGHSKYSDAHRTTIAIVSDSMVGSLRSNMLNSYILDEEREVIGKNPGATARQIGHNSIFTITEEAPKALVVVAGANDILYQSANGNVPNEVTIVNDIIAVGKQAVNMGVEQVYISSIIVMSTPHRERIRKRVNNLLRIRCLEEGFNFIDNSNIISNDLCNDRIHLGKDGLTIFMDNILCSCSRTYNPYMSGFYDKFP